MTDDKLTCQVCGAACALIDVVDFNKSCEEAKGKVLPLAGLPVYYALCPECSFCFAPEFSRWTLADFEERIYNSDYPLVDPDYLDARPRANAANLRSAFDQVKGAIRHLDYGGGNGLLAQLLCEANWNSRSYDPFVDRSTDIAQLGRFELVTAYEVFEHVPDVGELMSNLCSLRSSLIFFSTLQSDGNIKPHSRILWWYASPRNGHISLFSRKSLAVLAQKHGLRFASFSSEFHVFFTTVPAWAAHVMRPA